MSLKKKREKALAVSSIFKNKTPVPETELSFNNTYELIVAVILSAQCTDKRVNMITPAFFKHFPDPETLAMARQEEVFEVIKSCSYPNNKSKHLLGMAKKLMKDFNGIVPADITKLQELPGVGRKTANVIASVAFGMPAMPVDTHVFRVSQRIGLVSKSKTPKQVEEQLLVIVPENQLHDFHHWLILHGRYVCQARKPKCHECVIKHLCDFFQLQQTKKI